MKLKLVVVDLELSKRDKRILAAVLAPVLVIAGGAIAYAGTLHAWTGGDTLNAADLNGNFNQLDMRLKALEGQPAPVTVTAWASYTPTVTVNGSLVTTAPIHTTANYTPTTTGSWRRVGDTMEVVMDAAFPSCSAAGGLYWGLPNGLVIDRSKLPGAYPIVGSALAYDQSAGTIVIGVIDAELAGDPHTVGVDATPALDCSHIGPGGDVRLSFSVPIQGWTLNN